MLHDELRLLLRIKANQQSRLRMQIDIAMHAKIGFSLRNRLLDSEPRISGVSVSLFERIKTVCTDSHFLVPFFVLVAGIALLVVLR
jgi:hypothetical protein